MNNNAACSIRPIFLSPLRKKTSVVSGTEEAKPLYPMKFQTNPIDYCTLISCKAVDIYPVLVIGSFGDFIQLCK
jgi:hypothetical protein